MIDIDVFVANNYFYMKKITRSKTGAAGTIMLFILLLIVFPATWFILDKYDFMSKIGVIGEGDGPSEWSVVLLSYIGSVAAAAASYIAVLLSINRQERARRQDNMKAVLPLLSPKTKTRTSCHAVQTINLRHNIIPNQGQSGGRPVSAKTLSLNSLEIKNSGMRELYDLKIVGIKSDFFATDFQLLKLAPVLYKDDTKMLNIMFNVRGEDVEEDKGPWRLRDNKASAEVIIIFSYKDCYENLYTQEIKIACSYNFEVCRSPHEVFEDSIIQECEVISAPTLVG